MRLTITDEQFKRVFKPAAEAALRQWGLNDWDVLITHTQISDYSTYADCAIQSDSRMAHIRCTREMEAPDGVEQFSDTRLMENAEHEVLHLALSDIEDILYLGELTDAQKNKMWAQRAHAYIKRLQRVLRYHREAYVSHYSPSCSCKMAADVGPVKSLANQKLDDNHSAIVSSLASIREQHIADNGPTREG